MGGSRTFEARARGQVFSHLLDRAVNVAVGSAHVDRGDKGGGGQREGAAAGLPEVGEALLLRALLRLRAIRGQLEGNWRAIRGQLEGN